MWLTRKAMSEIELSARGDVAPLRVITVTYGNIRRGDWIRGQARDWGPVSSVIAHPHREKLGPHYVLVTLRPEFGPRSIAAPASSRIKVRRFVAEHEEVHECPE